MEEYNRIESYSEAKLMRSTQQLSITLPNEMAELVRAKVEAGEYATESEVIRMVSTLIARDRVVENWLLEKVGPAFDALRADPSRTVSAKHVREALSTEHNKTLAKQR